MVSAFVTCGASRFFRLRSTSFHAVQCGQGWLAAILYHLRCCREPPIILTRISSIVAADASSFLAATCFRSLDR